MTASMETERSSQRLIFGIVIIVIGVVFTLDNVGLVSARFVWKLWPLILIALSIPHLGRSRTSDKMTGFLLSAAGVLLLLRNFDVIEFSIWRLWPLVLVAVGVRMVLNTLQRPHPGMASEESKKLDDWVAFAGLEKRIIDPDFTGGSVSALFGGCTVDLRGLSPAGTGAVSPTITIDAFAFCGGVEILVPPGWDVVLNVLPILGGCDDETRQGAELPSLSPRPRLVVTGTAIMGGIGVKN
ncbi:MAG: hypothetical protein IT186_13155 [Acidobacteria bacterium]|nr:hypothetical protein [Acidobacteriota bacterium]MCG3191248.1 hypothetical protein [Thermoanaerobaculia bacterium]MCK6682440.1 DUF5668 domain-containing protein [Thermoanaerobaculia bacterium]